MHSSGIRSQQGAKHRPTSRSTTLLDTSDVASSLSSMLKSRRAAAARDGMKRSLYVTRALLGDQNGDLGGLLMGLRGDPYTCGCWGAACCCWLVEGCASGNNPSGSIARVALKPGTMCSIARYRPPQA